MADEQKPDGERQGRSGAAAREQKQRQGAPATSTHAERDRQNRDDPSRSPESGDGK
ncbi:MAG TPA: hypothetical protein VKD90_07010 [Gemmataceae bacterium]|nr:hypothetical protein [Gemmataceae bacterium]